MKSIEADVLARIGLSKNEAKIYLALLKLGKGTAVDLTKVSGVHRVNVYDVIERLSEKGLISKVTESDKRFFQPSDPKQLGNLLKEKEKLLEDVLPVLEEAYEQKKERQEVMHFFGPNGVMQAYYMMLEQKQTIYAIGGSGLNRKYLAHRHELWNKERIKRKINGKVLYYEFTRDDVKWDPTFEVKYLPDDYKGECMIDICGDLVINLIPKENNLAAIVIENKTLADTYRKTFEILWKNAKN